MTKRIVLITTGQPSCNPRIVKEADALSRAGYDVTMLYSFFIGWAAEKDEVLLKHVPWKYQMIGGSPITNKILYLFTRVKFKVANLLSPYLGHYFSIHERAQARCYTEMLQCAKKIKADWYIGHNLGALSIAVKAAKHNKGSAGFDFEDYYIGEHPTKALNVRNRIRYLEQKYIYALYYFSAASDLIKDAVKNDHSSFAGKIITLKNCFPIYDQPPTCNTKDSKDKSLKLFWFSQTVGKNRGLELLIEAMLLLNNPNIYLKLGGKCSEEIKQTILSNASHLKNNIHFVGIIDPAQLSTYAAQFDVGLALEPAFSENNDKALSNKIFTYLSAGNALVLSETTMQAAFNSRYQVGKSFAINDVKALAKIINAYFDTDKLNTQKKHNYELAKNHLNWENESKKLLSILN